MAYKFICMMGDIMNNQPYIPRKSIERHSRPLLFPVSVNKAEREVFSPKEVNTYEFFVLSDGSKRIYSENDAMLEYGVQKIPDPSTVSYMNLFINGILQPKANYEITQGKITLLTEDVPLTGCPIILQMIKI